MTELALPARSLQSALVAFNEGADAVYLGMKQFSARQGATNFSFEDLSKLRAKALATNKKIYVAINTLIDEDQLDDLYSLLNQVAFIGCDGVIVQDLGLVHIIKKHFPSLSLHGSTQLAVHTIEGVKEMARLGFERVVLARELTLQEIRKIREACPEVELKVFIHGALCYSTSGLCTASEQLCNRSANCGSCAQICRNYFKVAQDPDVPAEQSPLPIHVGSGWFFSMSDLSVSHLAKDLAELGIESLKVEGRMKSPAYTALASRTYRAILDGKEDTKDLEEALAVVFSRRQTAGWLGSYGREAQNFLPRKAPTLGSVSYPGHRGIKIARIASVRHDSISVTLEKDLSVRDGLMYFIQGSREPVQALKFGVSQLLDQRGRSITKAYATEQVSIQLPEDAVKPHSGEYLFLISRHDQNPEHHTEALPITKNPINLTINITDDCFNIEGNGWQASYEISPTKANSAQQLLKNIKTIFVQSDTSNFTLGNLTINNASSYALEDIFIPLSTLKRIRRSWYEHLDRSLARSFLNPFIKETIDPKMSLQTLALRSQLVTGEKLPYLDVCVIKAQLEQGQTLSSVLFNSDETYYFPLSPIMFDEEQFFTHLQAIITLLEKRNELHQVLFGLNNLGQVPFFRKHQLPCFIDIYLYLSNSEAAKEILELGLNLAGGYLWMERRESDFSAWPFIPTIVDAQFSAPLFISRSCFRHDSLNLPCEGCPHTGSWVVTGDKDRFRVLVKDCITVVVRA
ncbi:MAG: U32 family peptidase [Spirochaetia bacterium]|nr:U32 family peptidase [Spirochaetia bacterium]